MQLTNYSFLESRSNYLSSISLHKVAMQRLSTGTRLERSGSDTGSLSQSMRSRFEMMGDRSFITNLQNTRTFLHSQQEGLTKTLDIYNRMEEIAIRATDPTLPQKDRDLYSDEFSELQEQLETMQAENSKLLQSLREERVIRESTHLTQFQKARALGSAHYLPQATSAGRRGPATTSSNGNAFGCPLGIVGGVI